MTTAKKEVAASAKATAPKNEVTPDYNNNTPDISSAKQADRIAKHRKNIPRQYRRVYDVAQAGHSLRAAISSQCIECMGYVFSEVKLCCSPQCPLFKYCPLRGVSYGVSGFAQSGARIDKDRERG